MREEKLTTYLKDACPGRENAMTGNELEKLLHISGKDLRMLVNKLRRKGVPIGSGQEGYFYAVTAAEVYETILQLQGMLRGLEAAVHGLEKSFHSFSEDRK